MELLRKYLRFDKGDLQHQALLVVIQQLRERLPKTLQKLRERLKNLRSKATHTFFGIDLTQSWLVGEDEQCAAAASVNFMDSETWCDRFRPGMYEVRPVTSEQVKFLESRSFSNDNN